MIEFEKRWQCGMLSGSPSSFNSGASAKEAARFNWREALKWVLNDKLHQNGILQDDFVIRNRIKKELGED